VWDEAGLVLYAVDPGQYDLARGELDAERVCRRVREGGGTAIRLAVHSPHGYAYFPSEFAPLAPDYAFGRDYVGEFAEACRRHGLGLACSVNVAANRAVAETRPDWRQIEPGGAPHSWGGVPVMCLNTEYMSYVTDLVREVVARYGLDCICLDNFVLLDGCRCRGCEEALLADTGLELGSLAPGSDAAARYREWRFARTERLAWNLAMAAKALRGNVSVVFSGCGWSPVRDQSLGWRAEHTAEWMDNLETGLAPRWYGQDLSEADFIGAYHRALGKQGWCWVEYAPLAYVLAACPPTELRLKAASVIASGGRPCVWTLPPIPPADESGLEPLGQFFAQFADEPGCLQSEGSFARTAVLLSRQAFEATGRDTTDIVRAWCSALTREHILWDFALDRDLTSGGLSPYRVLIVPGTPYLPPRELAAIRQFVRGGGNAIFVGQATRFEADGQASPDFAAADLLGVCYAGEAAEARASAADYLRVAELPLVDLAHEVIPCGDCVPIAAAGAQVMADVIRSGPEPLSLPRSDGSGAPGITWRMQGGGRVVYVAATLVRVLADLTGPLFTSAEGLVGELARWLGGERVRVDAARSVSVQMHRAPGGATVHLLNRPAPDAHLHESVPPSGGIEITVPQALYTSNVRALDGADVQWQQVGPRLRIVVGEIGEYRCVRIEGALG